MEGIGIGSLRLSGEDARRFLHSLIRPSKADVEKQKKLLSKIDGAIQITKREDGYDATVMGLDLTSLDA